MHELLARQVQYREYQRQIAWVNEEDWKFARRVRRYRARRAIARALIALAHMPAPIAQRETHTT
jgi:hypothetical protein